ncbi:hypothetical protein T310_6275, partial [Rasamsonia emersonii CBS 393.64]
DGNVINHRAKQITERNTPPNYATRSSTSTTKMPRKTADSAVHQEGRILLAIKAFNDGQFKSIRAAAQAYNVPHPTLYHRLRGRTARVDATPNSKSSLPLKNLCLSNGYY